MGVCEPSNRFGSRSVAGLAVAAALCLTVSACSGDGSASPTPAQTSASPTPAQTSASASTTAQATPSGPSESPPAKSTKRYPTKSVSLPGRTAQDVHHKASSFIETMTTAMQKAEPSQSELAKSSTGSALQGVVASIHEYDANKWHQVGSARVLRQQVVSYHRHANPPTLTLAVCIDSSRVKVVDKSGAVVANSGGNYRTWNLFTMVKRDGKWLVSEQNFPNNPDC